MKKRVAQENLMILTDDQLEEIEEKNPEVFKQWKGYVYEMAYEIVTEESAAEGDAEERGWEVELSEPYASLEELLREVGSVASWVEWSSSNPNPEHDWLVSDSEQDMHTGAYKSYSLWIMRGDKKPLSKEEMIFISKALGLRGHFAANKLRNASSKKTASEGDDVDSRNKELDKKFVEEFKTLNKAVVYISKDGKNITTWMGTPLGKVLSMTARSNNFMSRSDTGEKLYSLKAKDNNGRLWFGTTHGPGMYARIQVKKSNKEASLTGEKMELRKVSQYLSDVADKLRNAASDPKYEAQEAARHNKEMGYIKKLPLEERKENAVEWFDSMKNHPDLIGERIEWLLAGNYGYGAMKEAEKVLAQSSRANKVAALSILIAALEWHTPAREAVAMWKKLSSAEKGKLQKAIEAAIKSHIEDKEADATWQLQHGKKEATALDDIKSVADVKRLMEEAGSPFFSRKTMKFFGDNMKNFGMRKEDGKIIIFRKKPTTYTFSDGTKQTFDRRSWVFDPIKKTLRTVD